MSYLSISAFVIALALHQFRFPYDLRSYMDILSSMVKDVASANEVGCFHFQVVVSFGNFVPLCSNTFKVYMRMVLVGVICFM